jgi:hypothetical protein
MGMAAACKLENDPLNLKDHVIYESKLMYAGDTMWVSRKMMYVSLAVLKPFMSKFGKTRPKDEVLRI